MAVGKNPGETMASTTVPAVGGDPPDAVTVSAMLNKHAWLRPLWKDAIAARFRLELYDRSEGPSTPSSNFKRNPTKIAHFASVSFPNLVDSIGFGRLT